MHKNWETLHKLIYSQAVTLIEDMSFKLETDKGYAVPVQEQARSYSRWYKRRKGEDTVDELLFDGLVGSDIYEGQYREFKLLRVWVFVSTQTSDAAMRLNLKELLPSYHNLDSRDWAADGWKYTDDKGLEAAFEEVITLMRGPLQEWLDNPVKPASLTKTILLDEQIEGITSAIDLYEKTLVNAEKQGRHDKIGEIKGKLEEFQRRLSELHNEKSDS